MKTAPAVGADGKLTNEGLGILTRKGDDIKRRINEKTIPFEWVVRELQKIAEGRLRIVTPEDTEVHLLVKFGYPADTIPTKALEKSGCKASLMPELLVSPDFQIGAPGRKTLAVVRVEELGFHCANFSQIQRRALELGFALCPSDAAFQIAIQKLVENGDELYVASNVIRTSVGVEHEVLNLEDILCVDNRDGVISIESLSVDETIEFEPHASFVFLLPPSE